MGDVTAPQRQSVVHPLRTTWGWGALALCVLYLAEGLAVLPYPGLQNDEALFASVLYPPLLGFGSFQLAGHTVSLMLMSYVGTLKSLLYVPILKLFGPTIYAIRLPMLVAGAATVWLLFLLLRRLAGPVIGFFAAMLLATDPSFILCTTFDWGPVALQLLLSVGAAYLLVRYVLDRRRWPLALASFLAGLALWNKAVFVWSLLSLAVALLAVFPRRLFRQVDARTALLAFAGFLAGAAPLAIYNIGNHGVTFTANAHPALVNATLKLDVLRATLDGSALLGYVVNPSPVPHSAGSAAAQPFAAQVAARLGFPRRTVFPIAIVASVFLLPFLWRSDLRDPALVALIYFIVHYLQMFVTVGAGTGAHHPVLLFPAPQVLVALCIGGTARRLRAIGGGLLAAAATVLTASNLAVTTTYLALLVTVGSPVIWTDAIGPLTSSLTRLGPRQVVVADWGLLASLRLLSAGRLPLVMGTDGLMADPVSKETESRMLDWLTTKDWYFVGHTPGNELFTGVRKRLDAIATAHGFRPVVDATINDSHGRPVFEIFRYTESGGRRDGQTGHVLATPWTTGADTGLVTVQRGAFYYQPNAAHWWFWDSFDLEKFATDLDAFPGANLDTVTFDIQVRDFVDMEGARPRLRLDSTAKLGSAIEEAERHGLKVMLVLWYTNGIADPAKSGGARLIVDGEYATYLEMTRQLAATTRGHPVTFFFTNELFDLRATYDPGGQRWRLKPFPPASKSFAGWAQQRDPDLARWNQSWGTSFHSWQDVDVGALFPRREYWDWLSSVIRSRLPDLVAVIKEENPLAKVGYEDYAFVYGWGDSAIPQPCPLDYVGFGIYRDMLISNADLAEKAYQMLISAHPGVRVFVPEVGMDTQRHTEAEQADWFTSIAKWARSRGVSFNVLMWRDYLPTPELPSLEESRYGLRRLDGSPKPAFRALGSVSRQDPVAGARTSRHDSNVASSSSTP